MLSATKGEQYTAPYFSLELEQMVYIFSVLMFFAFMLQRFTISDFSLIMIKLYRGWELVNKGKFTQYPFFVRFRPFFYVFASS